MTSLPSKPTSLPPKPASLPPKPSPPPSTLKASGSSTPQSSSGPSAENRKARRKRKFNTDAQSGTTSADPIFVPDDIESSRLVSNDDRANAFGQDDFIAFQFDGDDDEPEASGSKDVKTPKDASKTSKPESAGRKRRADEVDYTDGYSNKKQRVDAGSRRAPWMSDVDWERCQNVAELLNREVEAFVKYISPSPAEDELRALTVQLITRAVQEEYPDATVHPFGSYETKLYLPLGDIDLVILSRSMAYSRPQNVLYALAALIRKTGIADKVTVIGKAKVPIVKFVTRHGHFPVDISINQQNGIAAGKMIKGFLQQLPTLRALVLIIKSFLSQRSMNEVYSGGLGSYAIVCIAISFLQMHPKIRMGHIDPQQNMGVLVMEFFELYGYYFNYHEVGISLRHGGSYYNKYHKGWYDYSRPDLLSIEDPGDPSNDISKGSYNMMRVRTTLAGAHGLMMAATYRLAGELSDRRRYRGSGQRNGRDNPEDISILASVMGVTQETINHRRVVKEVYDSRVLHRMLGVEPAVPVVLDEKEDREDNNDPAQAAESVKSAWNSDKEESEDGEGAVQAPSLPAEEEEDSRYDVRPGQPPLKRRKMGKEKDEHTVYTTDEDEDADDGDGDDHAGAADDVHLHIHDDDADADGPNSDDGDKAKDRGSVTEEEEEYDVSGSAGEEHGDGQTKKERTRSYWLSKGIAT